MSEEKNREGKRMKLLRATVKTDGMGCSHDMPCAIHKDESAVLQMNHGVFTPSWKAQQEGWMLIKPPRWVRWILKKLNLTGIGKEN